MGEHTLDGGAPDAAGGPLDDAQGHLRSIGRRLPAWVRLGEPLGQTADMTPTEVGEKAGKTWAVEAPKRVLTTSESTLR
ncbi:hypothetical protein GCM10023226_33360 [Nocardioides nanhaiensis]|uniref:Uncharacterized protein n=1 Tax=Nocardioides nanhaiensis TaxID=1476871 RepID=A0ABP8WQE1_9ACTN